MEKHWRRCFLFQRKQQFRRLLWDLTVITSIQKFLNVLQIAWWCCKRLKAKCQLIDKINFCSHLGLICLPPTIPSVCIIYRLWSTRVAWKFHQSLVLPASVLGITLDRWLSAISLLLAFRFVFFFLQPSKRITAQLKRGMFCNGVIWKQSFIRALLVFFYMYVFEWGTGISSWQHTFLLSVGFVLLQFFLSDVWLTLCP